MPYYRIKKNTVFAAFSSITITCWRDANQMSRRRGNTNAASMMINKKKMPMFA